MKINEGFSLQIINNVPYILPYGQNIADHKQGVKLNETGLFLWNALHDAEDVGQLVERFADYCEAGEDEKEIIARDVSGFLNMLAANHILEIADISNVGSSYIQFLKIGDISIKISAPQGVFLNEFTDFKTSQINIPDLTIDIVEGKPSVCENGQLILRNEELFVCDADDKYILLFPMSKEIYEGQISKDGSYGRLYIEVSQGDTFKENIFHAIRLLFLYKGQIEGLFAVHSASILYKGRAWIFAGHSGTGKSTHTNLWNAVYNTPRINGDLNLLAIKEGKPIVYGMPWCGTSNIYDVNTYDLGGIVLVKKAGENECQELAADEKTLLIMQHMISPAWTKEQLNENIEFSDKIGKLVPVYRLRCTKTLEAVEVMKNMIDGEKKMR